MVQPGCAFHAEGLALQTQLSTGLQLRVRVVVAGLARLRPLARQAMITLQQQRLDFSKPQLQLEISRQYRRLVKTGAQRSGALQ